MNRQLLWIGWALSLAGTIGLSVALVNVWPELPRRILYPHATALALLIVLSWMLFDPAKHRRRIAALARRHPDALIWGARRTEKLTPALGRINRSRPSLLGSLYKLPLVYYVVADAGGISFVRSPGQEPWCRFAWSEIEAIGVAEDPQYRRSYPTVALTVPIRDALPATVDFTVYRSDGGAYLVTDAAMIEGIAAGLEELRQKAA